MCVRSFTAIVSFLVLVGPSCSNSDNLDAAAFVIRQKISSSTTTSVIAGVGTDTESTVSSLTLTALLMDTLRPIHQSVCDDKPVTLACPVNTSISILVAQFGGIPTASHECEAEVDRSCKPPNKVQYMLLQRVVEACQKKPSCKFDTNPGAEDPCPNSRMFVEFTYKCRPFDFRSLNACNEQLVRLSCDPLSRIAIFDVQYGRNELRDEVTCPQLPGTPNEICSTPYAVETVMRICHGKRRCQFSASRRIFDTLCKPYTRPYVKVVYACVPLGVLTERYESPAGRDENGGSNEPDFVDGNFYDGESGVPPVADPALQLPVETTTVRNFNKKEVLYKPTNKENDNANNSKIFFYSAIGLITVIIIVIVAVAVLCYYTRKAKEIAKNGEMFTAETPNVFNDASSDIDNDVEVSHISGTFYDPLHPDMILYRDVDGTRNTIRAMRPLSTIYPCAGPRMYGNVDYVPPQPREFGKFTRSRSKEEPEPELMTSPKSLGAYSTSQFYYG